MKIRILAIGKKHEPWVQPGVERYLSRLAPPYFGEFELIPHSGLRGKGARTEESDRILSRIKPDNFVILLDETGENLSSPQVSDLIARTTSRSIIFIIGGAYGIDERVSARADRVWSLSNLVFPHQLVRLILAEQLYRAQEINRGSKYHHP